MSVVRLCKLPKEPNGPARSGRSACKSYCAERDANLCGGVVQIEGLRALEHADMQQRDGDPTRNGGTPAGKKAKERSVEQLQPAEARGKTETQQSRRQPERVSAARGSYDAHHCAEVDEQDRCPEDARRSPAERRDGEVRGIVLRAFVHRLLQEPAGRGISQTP